MNDDRHLLEQFRQSRSEVAFRVLVERYVKLVYASAMRVLNGDVQLAEDVTQMVFSNLARKVPTLPPDVVLAGWLYRDARFTALEVLRKERRRARREEEAATMHQFERGQEESDASRLRPLLDELLDALQETDRNALVLRFFQGCDFHAVGAALGSTEDAARKRVGRALEKLQGLAKQRGITLSIAGLSIVMGAEAEAAVPASMVGTISSQILASANRRLANDLLSFMTNAKAKAVLVGALAMLMAGGLLLYSKSLFQRPVSPTRTNLRQQVASQTPPQSGFNPPLAPRNAADELDGVEDAIARLWRALHELPVDDQGNVGTDKVRAALRAFGQNTRSHLINASAG